LGGVVFAAGGIREDGFGGGEVFVAHGRFPRAVGICGSRWSCSANWALRALS
jgi:hypothetical protein